MDTTAGATPIPPSITSTPRETNGITPEANPIPLSITSTASEV